MFIIANWKTNPQTTSDALTLVSSLKKNLKKISIPTKHSVIVCPPHTFLSAVSKSILKSRIKLGAQDISEFTEGAHTGSVTARMIKDAGAQYCIVGHSERRKAGETNIQVAEKIKRCLELKITPIVCIGEWERDEQGVYLSVLTKQFEESFLQISKQDFEKIIIAYEPVWAISTSQTMAPTGHKTSMDTHTIHETVLFLRKIIAEKFKINSLKSVPILYGGSVDCHNAQDIVKNGHVQGLLVGKASLNAEEFSQLVKNVLE